MLDTGKDADWFSSPLIIALAIALTVLLGVLYPAAVWGAGQLVARDQAGHVVAHLAEEPRPLARRRRTS